MVNKDYDKTRRTHLPYCSYEGWTNVVSLDITTYDDTHTYDLRFKSVFVTDTLCSQNWNCTLLLQVSSMLSQTRYDREITSVF